MSILNNSNPPRLLFLNNDVFFESVSDLIKMGKTVTIPVKGFSMRPFLHNQGDYVVLQKTDFSQLNLNDILLARDISG